jgi:hypothetical protein
MGTLQRSHSDSPPPTEDIVQVTWNTNLSHYAVLFLDLLGQRKAMRLIEPAYRDAFRRRPGDTVSDEAMQAVRAAVGESVLAIQEFFMRFRWYMEDAENDRLRVLSRISPSSRDVADQSTRAQVEHRRYSDGLMVFAKIAPDSAHAPLGALFKLFGLCRHMMLEQLALGRPLRGGIDINVGVRVQTDAVPEASDDLLGPVVVSAYELESGTAKWPRIAVGPGVRFFLDAASGEEARVSVGEIGLRLAPKLRDMLFLHKDGVTMFDWLGKASNDVYGRPDSTKVRKALASARSQVDLWKAQDEEESRTLARRYAELADYIDSRRYLWT